MVFVLDTNIIIRYLRNEPNVISNFRNAVVANHGIVIPQVVDYEICRGFRLVAATRKKANYDILLQDCKVAEMDVLSKTDFRVRFRKIKNIIGVARFFCKPRQIPCHT